MTQAEVSSICEADFPAVAQFVAAQAGPQEPAGTGPADPVRRLRWALLENPARLDNVPPGWCVRDGGRIVGALLCVPFRIGAGDFITTALMASKFYVDPAYRGQGIGPLMRYLHEGRRFPLLATSANAVSGAIYQKCGGYLIDGLDHTLLGVVRPGPLIEEWMFRRAGRTAARSLIWPARWLRRRPRFSTRPDVSSCQLTPLASADELRSLDLPPPENALAVIRDQNYLQWRYFSDGSRLDVFRFHMQGQADRLAVIDLIQSGYRRHIRVLDLLDVWPATDASSAAALARCLSRRYQGRFDVMRLRSQPADAVAALRAAGFVPRRFPAPLGWCIDRSNLLPTRRWYLMPGESE